MATRLPSRATAEVVPLLPFKALQAEVLVLAERTRSYLTSGADPAPDPVERLIIACEAGRVVSRLGCCLAWLLARGPGEGLAAGPRLGGQAICLVEVAEAGLPPALAELMAASARLYRRIAYLDGEIARRSVGS